jgi:DNA (cytosine-5)-methyltransferase 1
MRRILRGCDCDKEKSASLLHACFADCVQTWVDIYWLQCIFVIFASSQIMAGTFTFVDLFSGCGGFSLGLAEAGGIGLIAVEKSESAFGSLAHNLGPNGIRPAFSWPSWFDSKATDIAEFWREHAVALRSMRGSVDVLAGGPPCQGFSTYGRRNRDDGRNRLYLDYLKVVEAIRPTIVLLENVEGIDMPFLLSGAKSGRYCRQTVASRIEDRLMTLGYETKAIRLCASDFGVPQRRARFILVAVRSSRKGVSTSLLSDDFFDDIRADYLSGLELKPSSRVTASQAISDLECGNQLLVPCIDAPQRVQLQYSGPRTNYQRQMRSGMASSTPPSSMRLAKHSVAVIEKFTLIHRLVEPGNKVGQAVRARLKSAKYRTYLLSQEEPSATVTTMPDDLIHYNEPRILTVRECARLQSFPDWFDFLGPYTTGGERRRFEVPRFSQVGNAVPPRLGAFLGKYASAILEDMRSLERVALAA